MSSIPCNNCRKSKKKCDKNIPCSRCQQQNVECVYNQVNLYKRGGTTKVGNLLDRAEKLENLLQQVLNNNHPHHNVDINTIINHWNNIKLEMTEYNDLNLPIALAWFQIEPSIPQIIVKSSSVIKRPRNSAELLILLNLYITYFHPVHPFINPQKLRLLLEKSDFDNPLLTSVLCRAQLFWYAVNNHPIPDLEEMEFYQITVANVIKNQDSPSLEVVQTYINLVILEVHQRQPLAASKHLTQAVYMSHQLDIHNAVPSLFDDDSEERACVWCFLLYLDFLCHLFLKQPRLIGFNPTIDMHSFPYTPECEGEKIYTKACYNLMKQYEATVKLSWDFPKHKKDFHPERTTESTILHLIELLSRAQTFVSMHINQDQLTLVNMHSSPSNLGYLLVFVKCCMLIIDVCELLTAYYRHRSEISHRYRKMQHECSLNLIEILFPQITNPTAVNLQHFEYIDPIFPQGAFHACKILLEDSVAIHRQYFGLSYKLCVQSTKLFRCNWLMMKYFEKFESHPYMILWNKEMEAEKYYQTP